MIFSPRSVGETPKARDAPRAPWLLTAALALLLGMLALASGARAAGGELDPTFSGDGKVVTDFHRGDTAYAIAIQPDGKVVAAGIADVSVAADFSLARYNADGSLDPSFGGDGKVVTDFSESFDRFDQALDVALQPDGKIVAAGESTDDFALARYNPDGSLDPTFDGDGRVLTDLGAGEGALGVAIQADGKIVAAGAAFFGGGTPEYFELARYNANGSLDPSFGGDGRVLTNLGTREGATDVAIQPDGRIIASGEASQGGRANDFALARYKPDGSLDASFDGDGRVLTNFGGFDSALSIAIQAGGKIVAAGGTVSGQKPYDFALARYNPDGSLDAGFGGDGRVVTHFGGADRAFGVAIQADKKIVAAGETGPRISDFRHSDFALARYNPNGSLDASFGGDGKLATDFGASDWAHGIAIQIDGRIVAAGRSGTDASSVDFALARYLPGPIPLDHFLDYSIGPGTPAFEPRMVTIRDQFRTSQARVVEPLRFLNPVRKESGRINRPDAHLKCYRIEESSFVSRAVRVQNQFGAQSLHVGQPRLLCNPAAKALPPASPGAVPSRLDHVRCYGAAGSALNRPVTLNDQFGSQQAVVDAPEFLCNPASKNGSQIVNPSAHLVCYRLGELDPFTSRRASLRDQFGVQTSTVVSPGRLCVPSRKRAG